MRLVNLVHNLRKIHEITHQQLLRIVVMLRAFAADAASKSRAIGPMIWGTPIEAFAITGGELAAVKSIFTADSEITVTRIEAFDEQGPRLKVTRVTGETLPCSPQPSLVITDGATTYTLSLSNHFEPKSMATYTDSGVLALKFGTGARIRLMIAPPKEKQPNVCMAKQLNVLIHYTTNAQ